VFIPVLSAADSEASRPLMPVFPATLPCMSISSGSICPPVTDNIYNNTGMPNRNYCGIPKEMLRNISDSMGAGFIGDPAKRFVMHSFSA
jgi:hypothetical protein